MTPRGLGLLAGLLSVVLAAGCAEFPAEGDGRRAVTVEAEGWAPLGAESGELTARHRALAEAQKKAVEKAVGVTLRASTRVDDAISIRESIVANMGGVIRRYEVLSEEAKDGFLKVRIRADVLYVPPAVPLAGRRAARFSVRIPDDKLAGAVREVLAVSDYQLSESDRDADVVVSGTVETYGLADSRLGGLYSYRAKVSLKAADVRNGKLMEGVYEGAAMDLDDRVARSVALERAGRDAGLALTTIYADTPTINASLYP